MYLFALLPHASAAVASATLGWPQKMWEIYMQMYNLVFDVLCQ